MLFNMFQLFPQQEVVYASHEMPPEISGARIGTSTLVNTQGGDKRLKCRATN